jgi:hypothetical protein
MTGSLVPLYRELVAKGSLNFNGLSIVQHATQIGALIQKYGATSAIDVGCGRGDQYRDPINLQSAWGLTGIYLYDPAFATHDTLPDACNRFDAVLCSDVLEHIPRTEVAGFIANLFTLADKFVWASVCCRPAKKYFPPDHIQNMHVTVRGIEWWRDRFNAAQRQIDLLGNERVIPYHLIETP